MSTMKRGICLILTLAIVCSVLPASAGAMGAQGFPVSPLALDVSELSCDGFISNAEHRVYINRMLRYYINADSKLQGALSDGLSVIFFFEGGSDNFPESAYEDGPNDVRDQAVVIVVRNNSNGKPAVASSHEICSTIPSDTASAIQVDGTYPVMTWNHRGMSGTKDPYGALQINQEGRAACLYAPDSDKDGYFKVGSGINIHSRSNTKAENWSAGCILVGTGNDSANYFNTFMRTVAGLDVDVWLDYNANQFNQITANRNMGYCVIDRQLAKTGLRDLYNDTALGKITAASDAARERAEEESAFAAYLEETYPCYAMVTTGDVSNLWNMPCSDKTSPDAQVLTTTAAGGRYIADRIYQNTEGNYWYRIKIGGTVCYLYSGNTDSAEQLELNVTVSGLVAPRNTKQGSSFGLAGLVSSPDHLIYEVGAYIYKGEQVSNSAYTSSTDRPGNAVSYDIKRGAVNQKLRFGQLPAGTYTYLLTMTVIRYDATGNTLSSEPETISLAEQVFAVADHTCDQSTFVAAEDAHPHYNCYSCSVCGKVSRKHAETNPVNSCDLCRPGKGVLNVNLGEDGTATFVWANTAGTTHYNVLLDRKNADGEWESEEQILYAQNGFGRAFEDGEYRAQLLSYNSGLWEDDGADWVHTRAEEVCFTVACEEPEPTYLGIDVSSYQGTIDWETVAEHVDFAIIKCGYGQNLASQDDPMWIKNADACTELGIPFGVYLYSYAQTEAQARSEAEHVLRLVGGYELSLPIYYDIEDAKIRNNCTNEEILNHARIFCETIEAAGYTPGIYSNYDWWTKNLTDPAYDRWSRWIAKYASETGYDKVYDIWQYTSSGSVPGISGAVDMNIWYGELPDLDHVHEYTAQIVDATCVSVGYTVYTCESCGDTYTEYDSDYSGWSEDWPEGVAESLIEMKTQYRCSDWETTTSYEPEHPDWTLLGSRWERSGSESVDYVADWPSGFLTSHSLYAAYHNDPVSDTETATDKTVVDSDEVTGYLYYHWCQGEYKSGPINRGAKNAGSGVYDTFHAFYSTTKPDGLEEPSSRDGSYRYENGACCKDSYWYFFTPVNTRSYTTYRNLFTYAYWGDWSEWSDSVYTETDTRKVETRTVYRTIGGGLGAHRWDEGVVTVEPTEASEGEILYTCLVCGGHETEILPVLEHTHDYTAVITEPTCTEPGFTTHTCRCGDSYVTDPTDALGHRFGAWYLVEMPTVTRDGLEIRRCGWCDHEEQRSIAKTGNPFDDVPEGSFFYDPVMWAVECGITNGTTPTTFGPNDQCMRAQVVTFLWRAYGCPEPQNMDNPFVDVKPADFYYKPVLWALENGITAGLDETHFGPMVFCNRAQVVTFLHRAMGDPKAGTADNPFTDVPQGQWFTEPVLWAVGRGITNGLSTTAFGPGAICNRAQIVTFLYRAIADW